MTTSVTTMRFFVEIMSTLKAIKSSFERSNDKQNITLVVISYEMTTRVISSMYVGYSTGDKFSCRQNKQPLLCFILVKMCSI